MGMAESLQDDEYNANLVELRLLKQWDELKIFEKQNQNNENNERYITFDGPPFATGKPHYGHILAGTVKDTYARLALQQGYQCDRVFGWDCHGVPVENIAFKSIGVRSPEKVREFGLAAYEKVC